jgi:hypothetical protein
MAALEISLRFAALLTLVGAVIGAYGLIAPRAIAGLSGQRTNPDETPFTALRGAFGGMLLMHAASFTALIEAPKIGSCLAAAVGAGWLGRSAGRAIASLLARRTPRRQMILLLTEAFVGIALWAPLWIYLDLIRNG